MCGISGVFGRGDRAVVESMLATLRHRGPDDAFVVGGDAFALGARRLSIVDVGGGRQPISNEDGTVWAVQNGELYNYPRIRPHLIANGHTLHTCCDTEVLPHLYEEHGADLPRHIDGMFAVAVWDDARQIGVLARDRMGKKPLYYYETGDQLYFASEIKALLRVPGFVREINLDALHHFLSLKHVPHPLSIFKRIAVLPPAHRLVFTPDAPLRIERYWDVSFDVRRETERLGEEELVDEFLALLRQAVERRFMSDVPIGFFLSGGLDSSLSTALAAELCPGRIKTFTLTYSNESTTPGKEQDRRWARWVAEKYGTDHHEETIEFTSFPDNLRNVLRCFDEPFAGVVSSYFLSQAIARHVKVALAGDGADELFGSYLSHRLAQPLANYPAYLQSGDASLIRPFDDRPDYLASLLNGASPGDARPRDWAWRSKLLVFTEEEKRRLYAPDVDRAVDGASTSDLLRETFDALTTRDPLNRVLEAEFRTIFVDQVLTYVDRLSMAHSLEARTAYLDTDVVEFVGGLPGRLKISDGETKYLLKKAALRYFPPEMVFRPKEGFLMPITQWILSDLEPYVRDTLSPSRLRAHGLFRDATVGTLIDRVYRPGADYRDVNKVLALFVFQEWYELYMT
ncbi:MAG TPA: asparagine synthase (glutamine-hydrolyzing) [Vicinamibacterales bacterium]|nr:asparagine synthase (glutamine-hydrolyzing) [Vicinamibacterales bacterium]